MMMMSKIFQPTEFLYIPERMKFLYQTQLWFIQNHLATILCLIVSSRK